VRARKVDDNQPDIVKAFRAMGCSVWITSSQGQGAPDLVVSRDGWTVAVEVKDGAKPPSARKLTKDEETWKANWKGAYAIVETVEQAHQLVADMRLRAALGAC
jgi:Holliday junction resolvase